MDIASGWGQSVSVKVGLNRKLGVAVVVVAVVIAGLRLVNDLLSLPLLDPPLVLPHGVEMLETAALERFI